ncbi:MAG TPA: hypothetical protein VFE69_03570 [Ilumatobacteraceae bacterium]|jgi:hypothetical protein|nr:hypothetical protein [Ilumatobacteraceae bacterium]
MTVELWRQCFREYIDKGTGSERTMARLLWEISMIDEAAIVAVFDRYASRILEAQA